MTPKTVRLLAAALVPVAAAMTLGSCETVTAKDSSRKSKGKPRAQQRHEYNRMFRGY